ncbi:MAG TPA: histidine kinase [Cytophagales bacterium]|nr:histidine kinase [Cytophagales bacterium]
MKTTRITIGKKLILGFLIMMLLFSGCGIYAILTIQSGTETIEKSQRIINPTNEMLNDFILLVNRSKMLATNWVYLQTNDEDKRALQNLQENEYPELKNRALELAPKIQVFLPDSAVNYSLDSIFIQFEEVLATEQEVINSLQTFEDYEDPIKKFMAEETISETIIPQSAAIIDNLEGLNEILNKVTTANDLQMLESFKTLRQTAIVLIIIILIIGIVTSLYLSNSITKPVKYLKGIIDKLSRGEQIEASDKNISNDEIGEMAISVHNLAEGLKNISGFAKNIGEGKYDVEFEALSDEDVLGNSLLEMRSNLKQVAEDDKKRNWATSGMAQFGEILRNNNNDFDRLSDQIISNLVKYLNANQGALFIVADEENLNGDDPYMTMVACYAWNKKKFMDKKIYKGEGLSGQAWIEGSTIFLTEVPEQYVAITSGLGEANPRCVVIVPLKVNDEIHGVLEIASFNVFEKYEIEFIEKVSESIASTISSVKVNERTQKLLKESTMMTEQMRAQEEEMRQNMEELQATQEKITRDQKEREARDQVVLEKFIVLETDKNFVINKANKAVEKYLGYADYDMIGKSLKDLLANPAILNDISNAVNTKKSWEGIVKTKRQDGSSGEATALIGMVHDEETDANVYLVYFNEISELVSNA